MFKENLLIPGPSPIPPEVARAMSTEMFNHRGPRFKELLEQLTEAFKKVFQTEGQLFILTASGTGAMEAAIVNFLSPGEKVISLVNGAFGDRLAQIAGAYGAKVERVATEWGQPLDYGALEAMLQSDREGQFKAVTVVHNESSTGMMNDLEAISRLRGSHPALLIVDAVSSMGAVDLPVDRWQIDICFTASQKALLMPPGISMVSAGERAWQASRKATMNKFYFSLQKARDFAEIGQPPFTPAISQMVAARTALELYFKEGREQSYARHRRMALAVRAAARALGLELLVEDRYASTTVTAIKKPESINLREMLSAMCRLGVEISGGQGKLSDHTFRFGHLGAVDEMDIIAGLAALEIALLAQGFDLKPGAGVAAAQKVIISGRQSIG